LYLELGGRNAMNGVATAPASPLASSEPADQPSNDQQRIEGNVAALAKRLEANPNDVQGWMMLANSYSTMGKYAEAVTAYEKAAALKGDDAGLLADYAFALAMKNDRKLAGQPQELLQRALKLDPQNPKALELAGTAAFEDGDYKKAIGYWQKVLDLSGSEPELRDALTKRIAEARKLDEKK
jgi:cytochrome c-type biogenesis protein CcmH